MAIKFIVLENEDIDMLRKKGSITADAEFKDEKILLIYHREHVNVDEDLIKDLDDDGYCVVDGKEKGQKILIVLNNEGENHGKKKNDEKCK